MPITKNHAFRNTVGMMHTAIKKDDVNMFRKVIEMKGDIYDFKGAGNFFPRALSRNSHKVIAEYVKTPDFYREVIKYKPNDFYYAINYGDMNTLQIIADLQLGRETLCIQSIFHNTNFAKIDTFILKSCILAFMIDPAYFRSLGCFNKDLFLIALTIRDFDAFRFLHENRESMDLKVSQESLKYIIDRACYANDTRSVQTESTKAAYQCLDLMLNNDMWTPESVENANLELSYSTRLVLGTPIDTTSNAYWRFVHHMITEHGDSEVTKSIFADFYAGMLSRINLYGDYINQHQAVFSNMNGRIKTVEIDKLAPMLLNSQPTSFCQNEARRIGVYAISKILEESNIDTIDILQTMQKTGKEAKIIKKAVALKAIADYGILTVVQSIKHVSYINALIELGYEPYELLTYANDTKIARRLTEMLMNT